MRQLFVSPLAIPAKVNAPAAAVVVLKVIKHLRWTPVAKLHPFVELDYLFIHHLFLLLVFRGIRMSEGIEVSFETIILTDNHHIEVRAVG